MAAEPDVAFIRNYFTCYELDPYCSANVPTKLEHDLEDCHCLLNCSFKFPQDARLMLLAGYQRLTSKGQAAFLSAHVRVFASPGQAQYRLPTARNGLEKVCEEHFLNTLQVTRDRVRQVTMGKRKSVQPEIEQEILPDKRIKGDSTRKVDDVPESIKEEAAEANESGDFLIDLDCVKVEETEPEQLILPDGPSVNYPRVPKANNLDETILPYSDEVSNNPVEHEPVDIKTETSELDPAELMLRLPSDDDSAEEDLLLNSKAENDENRREEVLSKAKIAENLRREHKIRGLSYTSINGRTIPARVVKPNCGPTCHYQCRTRMTEEARHELLANLLLLSQGNQRKFILDHICVVPVANPRSPAGRVFNYYFLPVETRLLKVCKTMFMNTYDISDRVMRRMLLKKPGDKRMVCGNPNFPALLKKGKKFYFEYDEGCDQAVTVASVAVPQHARCKCNLQCGNMFPDEMIEQIRSSYREKSKRSSLIFSPNTSSWCLARENDTRVYKRARFFLPFGSTVQEVCRQMFLRTFELHSAEVNTLLNQLSESPNLPIAVEAPFETAVNESEPMDMVPCVSIVEGNGLDERILPDPEEEIQPPRDQVMLNPENIKVEMNELETNHGEFMVVLTRDDDSVDEELLFDLEANDDDDDEEGHSATDSQGEISPSKAGEGSRHRQKERKFSRNRTLQPSCGDMCHLQCITRVSEEQRQELLTMLLQMSLVEQRMFIADHICGMPVARMKSLKSRRTMTFHYFLPVDGRLVKVCRTMFVNTYDLTDRRTRTIFVKKSGGKHVVCGNPYFPMLLKTPGKFYFDYDEVHDQEPEVCKCNQVCERTFRKEVIEQIQLSFREKSKTEQDKFFSKHIRLLNHKSNKKNPLFRASYFLPHGSTQKEVCRIMFQHVFKLRSIHVRALVENMRQPLNPLELAKEHVGGYRMEEDHHCAVSGILRKLSHSPNLARMYSEYREEVSQRGVEPVDYRQYFGEFCRHFAKTGLLRLTSCPDCGYFDKGEGG